MVTLDNIHKYSFICLNEYGVSNHFVDAVRGTCLKQYLGKYPKDISYQSNKFLIDVPFDLQHTLALLSNNYEAQVEFLVDLANTLLSN